MKNITLSDITIGENTIIKEAMRVIDLLGLRLVYIVDKENKLLGVVSDSEIRKAIIKGVDIKEKVTGILNPAPLVLKSEDLKNPYQRSRMVRELRKKMPGSEYILVVDKDNHPTELIPLKNLDIKLLNGKHKNGGNNKHILVVGGAGYLGSVLTEKLVERGYRVRILDLLMYGEESLKNISKNKNVEVVKDDMRNISTLVKALADIDAVVNLAALVGDPMCKDKPEMAIETNYLANKALADAAKYHQINRFLYASTCSVYGESDDDKELDENASLNPVSLYARSKIQSEEALLDLQDENFAPTILRMSTLYGHSHRMRFDLVVNTMTKNAAIDKKITVFGGGKHWRPLLHVEDAADAYVKCLEAPLSKVKGEIFNVGSNLQNFRIIDIANAVHKIIPDAELSIEGENNDPRNYVVSFSKIEKTLEFKAVHSLESSITRMHRAITQGEIKDTNDPCYYNVKYNFHAKSEE
ncbi:NAD-dependent epimerase/dehydratase family protein [Candidatus Peregrinibacteria bacterium]|nr:NAD-dependent epimerase/dehydratase family protein [Candidatus Peregrinibacteria bacterium]